MATKPVTTIKGQGDDAHAWLGLSQGDDGSPIVIKGGKYMAVASGDFAGSASAGLQYSPDGAAAYTPLTNGAMTAAGHLVFDLADGYIKPVIGSGNDSTAVDYWFKFIRGSNL